MKLLKIIALCVASMIILGCNSSFFKAKEAEYSPQKIITTVNTKYPGEKTDLIYIPAPVGFIAPHEAVSEVNSGVDTGKVVDIVTALTVKTSTVIITGNDDDLTAATLSRALSTGNERIAGSKIVYVGGKQSLPKLSKLASNANVAIEFIDTP